MAEPKRTMISEDEIGPNGRYQTVVVNGALRYFVNNLDPCHPLQEVAHSVTQREYTAEPVPDPQIARWLSQIVDLDIPHDPLEAGRQARQDRPA